MATSKKQIGAVSYNPATGSFVTVLPDDKGKLMRVSSTSEEVIAKRVNAYKARLEAERVEAARSALIGKTVLCMDCNDVLKGTLRRKEHNLVLTHAVEVDRYGKITRHRGMYVLRSDARIVPVSNAEGAFMELLHLARSVDRFNRAHTDVRVLITKARGTHL